MEQTLTNLISRIEQTYEDIKEVQPKLSSPKAGTRQRAQILDNLLKRKLTSLKDQFSQFIAGEIVMVKYRYNGHELHGLLNNLTDSDIHILYQHLAKSKGVDIEILEIKRFSTYVADISL